MDEPFRPDWGVHPSELLREAMEERGLDTLQLATGLHQSHATASLLAGGELRINEELALGLGAVFGNSPTYWANLQRHWDEHLARQAARP